MNVAYPFPGERYLLEWSTSCDRNHVALLSPNFAAAERFWTSALAKDPTADFLRCRHIRLVAPPPRVDAAHEHELDQTDYYMFWCLVESRFRKEPDGLPGLSLCVTYDAEDGTADDDPGHYQCRNCHNRVRPVGEGLKDYYDRFRDRFFSSGLAESARVTARQDKRLRPSTAADAATGEDVHVALGDFGNHARGAYTCAVPDDGNYGFSLPALFFFVELDHVEDTVFERTAAASHAAVKARQAASWEDNLRQYTEYERQADAKWRALFKGET